MVEDKQAGLWPEEIPPKKAVGVSVEDQAKKDAYRKRLTDALRDPAFRKTEGFPLGTDEAILALSDPPEYTACPNPFVAEWLAEHSTPYNPKADYYSREPFAADVSEGKNDPIYNAHSYHTKVPHKAIMRYILHYTNPGDVILDGFCGTGMTGVAASLCGDKAMVEALGYLVNGDGTVQQITVDASGKEVWTAFSHLGVRKAILNDLSPVATFIAHNYNHQSDSVSFKHQARSILDDVETECGWMYRTIHTVTKRMPEANLKNTILNEGPIPEGVVLGTVQYVVWSDVFVCPECTREIVFWDTAVDREKDAVRDEFPCPGCKTVLTKKRMDHIWTMKFDKTLGKVLKQAKQVPVLINYAIGKKRYEKRPDIYDLSLIEKIEQMDIPYWFPTDRMPEGRESRRNDVIGITHVHHFFTKRNLYCLSAHIQKINPGQLVLITGIIRAMSRLFRWAPRGKHTAGTTGTLYIPSISHEYRIRDAIERRLKMFDAVLNLPNNNLNNNQVITTQSSGYIAKMKPDSVDYIFTDPPFGGNLMYSELNFLWEAWLRVFTNSGPEAIQNNVQKKYLFEYRSLMARCFAEYYRVLKPGRWMTVVFHNSQNSVWEAIREAIQQAGFIIADVRILDKQQQSFKQVTSTGAVKKDLVISAYKPRSDFESRFETVKGKPEGVLEFLAQHLAMLPVAPVTVEGFLENLAERTRYVLFDRMVAYHLVRNARIPMSASEFYQLLDDQFVCRDEMFFLPDQAVRYDAVRVRTEVEQLPFFIRNERSAVQWIRNELEAKPQTLGELRPKFMQAMPEWDKVEERVELANLLKEYFVRDSDERWRVPNPNRAKDMDAMRRKTMLKIFEGYASSKGVLKVFRREALHEGFCECWQTKQYGVIVAVSERLPTAVLQESPDIKQFYDIARDRAPQQPAKNTQTFLWEA